VRFRIEPKPYSEALIDLALQSDVSLLGAAACAGDSPLGLHGAYSVEEALGRLLAAAPCGWRVVAPGVVQIQPLAPAAAPTHPPALVGELLVTATKRVQNSDRLAAAISVISRRQLLAATGVIDPGETSGLLAGVLTTDLGPARDKLLLRGLSDGAFTGRSRSTVGTYLDDTPLNYNAPDPDLRLVDVERVEVVRGPQGSLYGGGSISGIYRIVPRKPDLDRFSAELRLTGDITRSGGPSHAMEGFANLPLLNGRLGLRASAYQEVQGGYLDDVILGGKNVDRTMRLGGRVALTLQPTDTWSVDLSATGQHLRSDDTHYTFLGLGLLRAHRIPEPHDNDISLVDATLHGSWSWGDLSASTSYVQHVYSSVYDASRVITLFSADRSGVGLYAERTRTEMLVQDVVLTSRGAGRLGWLAGFYASRTFEDSPSSIQAGADPNLTTVYRDVRRDRIQEFAVYGEAAYQLAPGWRVAAGTRVFQTQVKTRSSVTAEQFPARDLARTVVSRGVSPKLTLQHDLASGDLIYAVISEGHRAGGVNSGGGVALAPQREIYGPDRLLNFEVGAKLRLLDRRLTIRSAAFYDLWKNIQTDQFRASGLPYTANVGDAGIAGLEAEADYAFDNGLSVGVNTLLTRTHILRSNPDYAPQLANGLPNAPAISGGVVAEYQRPLTGSLDLRLMGMANYVGRSRVTFDPALSSRMGGYARVRLSAGVGGPHWNAELFVVNPLNNLGNTFAFGNPFTFLQTAQSTPQRPTTVGVTLSATR
jgi:outer membrane receptor protein involved in Fe transport